MAKHVGRQRGTASQMSRPPTASPALSGTNSISLVRLLAAFLKIGSIGFGGGMAVITLMEREFVQKRKLLTGEEFLHGAGLGQILGAFSVNASFFVGYRLFGLAGGLLSASVFLMPSLAMVTALSHFYFRYHSMPALQGVVGGLGPVVIALILDASWTFGRQVLRSAAAVRIAGAALAAGVLHTNAVWVILVAGAIGLLLPNTRRVRPGTDSGPSTRALSALAIPATVGPVSLLGSTAMTFLKMGLVFFGGGFALVPVLHHRLVTQLGWLSPQQFLDGVAISNLTPGPIAVLATFVGYREAGIPGALVATAALLAPAMGLMWLLSGQYERYHGDPHVQRFLAGVNPAVTGTYLECCSTAARQRDRILAWVDTLRSIPARVPQVPLAPCFRARHRIGCGICRNAALRNREENDARRVIFRNATKTDLARSFRRIAFARHTAAPRRSSVPVFTASKNPSLRLAVTRKACDSTRARLPCRCGLRSRNGWSRAGPMKKYSTLTRSDTAHGSWWTRIPYRRDGR